MGMKAAKLTEAAFTDQVTAFASLFGWLVHHDRPAMTRKGYRTAIQGSAGFVDLVLVHPKRGRLCFAELKVTTKPTPDQAKWIEALRSAGAEVHLWRPEDWPAIEALVKGA